MALKRALVVLLAAGLAAAPQAGHAKERKPRLDLRVAPRSAFSPVTAYFTAELTGGDDLEEFYCPELEWDWDDGGKTTREGDCPAYAPGTAIERHFTAEHEYRVAGGYVVKLTLRHDDRTITSQTVHVTVKPGLGDTHGG